MSYLVLARKWRPQTFNDVVAQRNAIQALQNAIRLKRLPHALLLCGSRGIGKTTIARLVAKTINCESRNPEEDDPNVPAEPCNQCSMCEEITQGRATDVIEIDGASNRSIDDIREIRDNVQYLPTRGRRKVYIIDEVHMLTREAFNALLKTLEEPPSHVLFTFATTEPHKIPITILSRCQRFDLKRITLNETCDYLRTLAEREGLQLSDNTLMMIARAADGGMRDALSLMDQVVAFGGEAPSDEEAAQAIGAIDRAMLHKIGNALLQRNIESALQAVGELFSFAYDLKQLTQELASFLRDLMVAAVCQKPAEVIDLPSNEIEAIQALVQDESPDRIQQMFRLLTASAEEIAHASHPRLLLEMTLIQMARVEPIRPFDEVLQHLHQLEDRLVSAGGEPPPGGMSGPSGGNHPGGHHSGGMGGRPQTNQPPHNTQAKSTERPTQHSAPTPQQRQTPPPQQRQTPTPPQRTEPKPTAHPTASQPTQQTSRPEQAPQQHGQPPRPQAPPTPQPPKAQTPPPPQPPAPQPDKPTPERAPKKRQRGDEMSMENLRDRIMAIQAEKAREEAAMAPQTPAPTPQGNNGIQPPQSANTSEPVLKEDGTPIISAPIDSIPNKEDLIQRGHLDPDLWYALVEKVKEARRILSGPLDTAYYTSNAEGQVVLYYRHDQGMLHDTIKKRDNTQLAEKLFAEEGTPLKLDVQILPQGAELPPNADISLLERRRILHALLIQRLTEEAQAHPRMKQLLRLIPGTTLSQIEPLAEEETSDQNTT